MPAAIKVLVATMLASFGLTNTAHADDWTLKQFPSEITADHYHRPVKECDACPTLVIVPPGEFDMGSPDEEPGREAHEGPVHRVRIAKPFAIGRYEVTLGEFRAFVIETGYVSTAQRNVEHPGCFGWPKVDKLTQKHSHPDPNWIPRHFWARTGIPQKEGDPVRCVSLEDAYAFVAWLNKKAPEKGYRLPSEAEWEYAARAGSTTPWFWGDDRASACRFANINDINRLMGGIRDAGCVDDIIYVAGVGTFTPNPFGLYDTAGNVEEWVADCYYPSYVGAPVDGSAWHAACASIVGVTRQGNAGVTRGGHYAMDGDPIQGIRSAARNWFPVHHRTDALGFRVARTIR